MASFIVGTLSFFAWALIVIVVILGSLLLYDQQALGSLAFVALVIALGFVLRRRWSGAAIGPAIGVLVAAAVVLAPPRYSGVTYRFAYETAAIKGIQTIHTMEAQYKSQYGRYATSLAELGPPASGAPSAAAADLISNDLASGEKSRYKFTLTGSQDGYAIHADPVKYGPSSSRTFYSDQTLTLHEN